MGFANGKYATCWTDRNTNKVLNLFEKYAEVQITTSKKKKDGDKETFETDFSGRVRFVGKSFDKIKRIDLREKDRLKLLEVETCNRYDKEKKRSYESFIVWDFETVENRQPTAPQTEVVGGGRKMESIGDIDCELPF
jgi:hypothetical protein